MAGRVTRLASDRFAEKVNRHGPRAGRLGCCWLWTAASTNGYGAFSFEGRRVQAHRWAFEQEYGPIPAGLEPDHRCRRKLCVRPSHMEAVTHAENIRRTRKIAGAQFHQLSKTRCPQDHPLDLARMEGGRRVRRCSVCRERQLREGRARYRAKRRAA